MHLQPGVPLRAREGSPVTGDMGAQVLAGLTQAPGTGIGALATNSVLPTAPCPSPRAFVSSLVQISSFRSGLAHRTQTQPKKMSYL